MKEELVREKVIPPKFKKTGITGKIVAVETPEDDEPSPPKKSKMEKTRGNEKSGKKGSKSGKQGDEAEEEEDKPVMKSVVRKGGVGIFFPCFF